MVHDLQGMGCDREQFVVKWDQQCTQDEAADKGRVGIVVDKSDDTVRKASAAARPSGSAATGRHRLSSCLWYAPNLVSSALFMSDCAARRWWAGRTEPTSALVRRVESLPMHTHTHGERSGHFDLFRRPSFSNRGRRKDPKTGHTIERSLPPGYASAMSRRPERRLISCIQLGCGPAQPACRRFEVPRHLRHAFVSDLSVLIVRLHF